MKSKRPLTLCRRQRHPIESRVRGVAGEQTVETATSMSDEISRETEPGTSGGFTVGINSLRTQARMAKSA
jgi:hypothetical protein